MVFNVIWIVFNVLVLLGLSYLNGIVVRNYEQMWIIGLISLPAVVVYLLEVMRQIDMIYEEEKE